MKDYPRCKTPLVDWILISKKYNDIHTRRYL